MSILETALDVSYDAYYFAKNDLDDKVTAIETSTDFSDVVLDSEDIDNDQNRLKNTRKSFVEEEKRKGKEENRALIRMSMATAGFVSAALLLDAHGAGLSPQELGNLAIGIGVIPTISTLITKEKAVAEALFHSHDVSQNIKKNISSWAKEWKNIISGNANEEDVNAFIEKREKKIEPFQFNPFDLKWKDRSKYMSNITEFAMTTMTASFSAFVAFNEVSDAVNHVSPDLTGITLIAIAGFSNVRSMHKNISELFDHSFGKLFNGTISYSLAKTAVSIGALCKSSRLLKKTTEDCLNALLNVDNVNHVPYDRSFNHSKTGNSFKKIAERSIEEPYPMMDNQQAEDNYPQMPNLQAEEDDYHFNAEDESMFVCPT